MKRKFWRRLGRAFVEATGDGCLGCAKAAAYSALLSIFPVLSSVAAVFAQVKATAISSRLVGILFEVAPPGTEELLRFTIVARGERPVYLLVGAVLLSALAASGVILSLIDGFHFAYRVKNKRSFWRQRSIAMLLVFVAAAPVIGASAIVVYTGKVITYAIGVFAVAISTMLLYHFGPDLPREMQRSPVWPGALVATGIWMIATAIFVWYVRNLANYNVIYGSIAAVIALMVWLYLLAASALIGCEYNAERLREDFHPA